MCFSFAQHHLFLSGGRLFVYHLVPDCVHFFQGCTSVLIFSKICALKDNNYSTNTSIFNDCLPLLVICGRHVLRQLYHLLIEGQGVIAMMPEDSVPQSGHVVVVPIFDTTSAPVHVWLRLPPGHEHDEKETRSSTIRLAHAASGRMKEVAVVAGPLKAERIAETDNLEVYPVAEIIDIIQSQVLDLPDHISLEVSEELQSNNPRLCEAVLRAMFAPKGPGDYLEECMRNAEIVKTAFTLQPNVYTKAESRALKVAQYRRAGMLPAF